MREERAYADERVAYALCLLLMPLQCMARL